MVMSAPPAAISADGDVVGLLRRPALRVDRGAGGGEPEPLAAQPGVAGDVRALLPRLGDAPADHFVDQRGLDAGAIDHRELRRPQDLGRLHAGEPAVALPDRGSDGFDDDRRAHGVLLTAHQGRRCDVRV